MLGFRFDVIQLDNRETPIKRLHLKFLKPYCSCTRGWKLKWSRYRKLSACTNMEALFFMDYCD
jgi:hypothetical protein